MKLKSLALVVALGLALVVASWTAVSALTAGAAPNEAAQRIALMLTWLGAIGVILGFVRRIAGRMRGERLPKIWPPEVIFAPTLGGWLLLLPCGLALKALQGESPHYIVALVLSVIPLWGVGAAAGAWAFMTSFGDSLRAVLLLQSIVLVPSIFLLTAGVRLVIAIWRAAP